jgi:hypothetical protein
MGRVQFKTPWFSQCIYVYRAIITVLFSVGELKPIYTKYWMIHEVDFIIFCPFESVNHWYRRGRRSAKGRMNREKYVVVRWSLASTAPQPSSQSNQEIALHYVCPRDLGITHNRRWTRRRRQYGQIVLSLTIPTSTFGMIIIYRKITRIISVR